MGFVTVPARVELGARVRWVTPDEDEHNNDVGTLVAPHDGDARIRFDDLCERAIELGAVEVIA